VSAAACLPGDAILDGEILIWSGDRPRPFADLQTRLNRKVAPSNQLGLFDESRLVMIAFDLLEHEGADLRDRPQAERRAALEALLAGCQGDTLRVSPLADAPTWDGLASLRHQSRDRGVEGLMLKHRDATYGVGRARSDTGWWKWKVDPFTIDAVLVSAQPGSGRRASLYTDYTFAVWDCGRDEDERSLVTFAKAYSGLTQEEIETLDRWIRTHTTKKAGPFRQVEPVQVFELAFEGVRLSKRHKSGVAVRFPRIARWRTDKPASEADTIEAVRALVPDGGTPGDAV
jgi:DNA ligase-1